jgi:tellurite resistance protein
LGVDVDELNKVSRGAKYMLPDTLYLFDRQDRRNYCRILAAIALADGRVTMEEMANYESRMGMALLTPEERVMMRQELKRGRSFVDAADDMHPAHLRIALRDALLMAAADGHYDAREIDIVKKLARKAAFSDQDLESLYDWIDDGWEWMKRGRRVLQLPEEIRHWNTVYEDEVNLSELHGQES